MALLYRATMTPTKAELMAAWLPQQPWFDGDGEIRNAGAFRFDDPDGEVGIETVLAADRPGSLWQLPFTYRAKPLPGAEQHPIATMEHSVLGTRYVYDAVGDPVYLDVVRATILGGGRSAELLVQQDDGTTSVRDNPTTAYGTGSNLGAAAEVMVVRRLEPASEDDIASGSGILIGELPDYEPLALVRLISGGVN